MRDMQKALMALSSSPKSKIVKVGKQLNVYVSNFTDDQKLQNKKNLCIYFKRKLFQVKEFSFYFWFKKGAKFKFVSLC